MDFCFSSSFTPHYGEPPNNFSCCTSENINNKAENILSLPPCCSASLCFLLTSVELVITEYDLLNSKYTYIFSLYYGYIRVSMASFIPLAITGFLVHKFTTAPCTSNRDGQEETNACGRRTSSSTGGRLDRC